MVRNTLGKRALARACRFESCPLRQELHFEKSRLKASPTVARKPCYSAKKFSLQFLIWARHFFLLKGKENFCARFYSEQAGRQILSAFCIRSGVTEFPPTLFFRYALAGTILFFRHNLRLYFAKQNALSKEMLPLTYPTLIRG